jgi:hypothetical protein
MAKQKTVTVTLYRSAINGQFINKGQALKDPKHTVKETVHKQIKKGK